MAAVRVLNVRWMTPARARPLDLGGRTRRSDTRARSRR
ncbi:MAG: hypothetical protein AVDCRST_MAG91-3450 [uncultured Sphingomonadaceae bacterium]|uniref:Uncharacterized protein n=1 Tax=uncultured Sphingomonadaceae bacterium TaxID=169976 RepID=A0A6J4U083_9SPHN|nr:MAG: hypothetical protein AVDCRST_MAG91-3450 [uncultured Sphingomonadaceae bacterium]